MKQASDLEYLEQVEQSEWMEGLRCLALPDGDGDGLDLRQCSSPLMAGKTRHEVHRVSPQHEYGVNRPSMPSASAPLPPPHCVPLDITHLSRSSSFSSYSSINRACIEEYHSHRYSSRSCSTEGDLSTVMEEQMDPHHNHSQALPFCEGCAAAYHRSYFQHVHVVPKHSHYTEVPTQTIGWGPARMVSNYNSSEGNTPVTPTPLSTPVHPPRPVVVPFLRREEVDVLDSDSEKDVGDSTPFIPKKRSIIHSVVHHASDLHIAAPVEVHESSQYEDYPVEYASSHLYSGTGRDIYGLGLFSSSDPMQGKDRSTRTSTRSRASRAKANKRRYESDEDYVEDEEEEEDLEEKSRERYEEDDDDDDDLYGKPSRGRSSDYYMSSNDGGGGQAGRKKAPEYARTILMDWLVSHQDHPYPTKKEKEDLARRTGMGLKQIMHWMSNVRKRRFLPLISGRRKAESSVDVKFLEEFRKRIKKSS